MSDFEFMEYYVHIMLVGANDGHVYTAIQDQAFKPIRRIYLIHSPNQKKSSSIKKPILFKKVAQKLKTEIEKHNPAKVILKQLTEKGPFDKLETITEITKIVKINIIKILFVLIFKNISIYKIVKINRAINSPLKRIKSPAAKEKKPIL